MGLIANSIFKRIPSRWSIESIAKFFEGYSGCGFRVRLWDGSTWGAGQGVRFTLVVKNPSALEKIFLSPSELSLGEAYIFDDLDIEGDIEAAVEMGDYLLSRARHDRAQGWHIAKRFWNPSGEQSAITDDSPARVQGIGAAHSRDRDRQAISYHYDLPAEFFALWLDPQRVYSCAYFDNPECDLDAAQRQKLDYICKKLRLRKGDRLLDVGCGWGGLLTHAAAHYGAQALGITLSIRQAEVARQRIRDAGLSDHCRVELCDYRDLELDEQFDKIVSVGMFEHVGKAQLPEYFLRMWQLLRAGGSFVNTGIAASATYQRRGPSFIDRYVFPDGELVPISDGLDAAEKCGFEIRDVESLREHYALTLHHWVRRLEAHAEEAQRITNPTTYRIWRLYMAGSAHAFRAGRFNLYQVLLVKPSQGFSGVPLTRTDWYRDPELRAPS